MREFKLRFPKGYPILLLVLIFLWIWGCTEAVDEPSFEAPMNPVVKHQPAAKSNQPIDLDDNRASAIQAANVTPQPVVDALSIEVTGAALEIGLNSNANLASPALTHVKVQIAGDNGVQLTRRIVRHDFGSVDLTQWNGGVLPDGRYKVEVVPQLQPIPKNTRTGKLKTDINGREIHNIRLNKPHSRHFSAFRIKNGGLVTPTEESNSTIQSEKGSVQ